MPRMTSIEPSMLFERKFNKAVRLAPALTGLTLSRAKVEKVVRAPRKPVAKKSRAEGDIKLLPRSAIEKDRPIRKQPDRLTISVPQGNPAPKSLAASRDAP